MTLIYVDCRYVHYIQICGIRSINSAIGVFRVGLVAALHPPLVSHPPFNFAPGCTNGPKDWVQKNGLNISSSKRHSPFIYVYPLKSANKSSLPPGSGCKKGWVRSSFAPGCEKKIFEVGPKKEECEKGGGCEAVSHLGAKKNFRALRARTHLKKSCIRPCQAAFYQIQNPPKNDENDEWYTLGAHFHQNSPNIVG